MKITVEERVRKSLLRFGRKNKICRILVLPVIVVSTFVFHAIRYCGGNYKRFAMIAMTFCLFVVYSSFSFPLFITGEGRTAEWSKAELDSDVELAPESELRPEDMELLSDEDLLADDELVEGETVHGMDGIVKYEAEDILEALETNGNADGAVQEEASRDESGEIIFDRNDWRLVLINKQHSIPEDYTFTLGTIRGSQMCDERIVDDLKDMLQAAKDEGMNLVICSPYRTPERQEYLFGRKITEYMRRGFSYVEAYQMSSRVVTIPGNSEHEIGLAFDIVCDHYDELKEGFGDTVEGKWLAKNSCKYGFILRYPKGKEDVTGIDYEPWHFRYVGVDAATVITESGITLEEFWEEL